MGQSIKITINDKSKKVICLEAMIQKLVNEIMTSNDVKLLLRFLKTFGPAINIKDEVEKCIKSVNEESGISGYELQARFNQLLDLINGFDRTNMIPEEYIIDN